MFFPLFGLPLLLCSIFSTALHASPDTPFQPYNIPSLRKALGQERKSRKKSGIRTNRTIKYLHHKIFTTALIDNIGNIPLSATQITINVILKSNYFTFNDKFYLQTQGTAMGSSFAPNYANIFLGYLKEGTQYVFREAGIDFLLTRETGIGTFS